MNITTTLASAILVTSLTLSLGCASTTTRVNDPYTPSDAFALTDTIDLTSAATRALAVSPKVRAAAARLTAATERSTASTLPPDPTLLLSFGIPIDSMGGTGISATLMTGIGWLLAHDAIVDAATREQESAARALLSASAETAADARRLLRAVEAGRRAVNAASAALDAQREMLAIEIARADAGEMTRETVLQREAESLLAASELAQTESETHESEVALISLLAIETLTQTLEVDDISNDTLTTETLEVIRARVEVARTHAALAELGSILGSNAEFGGGYMRDLEDREAVEVALKFSVPIFRRSHEVDAARADVIAAEADLEEAVRVASVDNDHAIFRRTTARTAAQFARESQRALGDALAITAYALVEGEATRADVAQSRMRFSDAQLKSALRDIALAEAIANVEQRAVQGVDTLARVTTTRTTLSTTNTTTRGGAQ